MKLFPLPAAAAAMLLVAACEAQPPHEYPPGETPRPAARAEVITDTIMVEGMAEPTTSQLVQSPGDAAVAFSTYVPEGIEAEVTGAGDTVAVRFMAAFAGTPDPHAFMHVRFHPPGVDVAAARETVMQFLLGRVPDDAPITGTPTEPQVEPREPAPWADEAWGTTYRGEGDRMYVTTSQLARHGGRTFHVITHYPAEYGDGLGPRFQRILQLWRWDDTGAGLTGS